MNESLLKTRRTANQNIAVNRRPLDYKLHKNIRDRDQALQGRIASDIGRCILEFADQIFVLIACSSEHYVNTFREGNSTHYRSVK